MNFVFDTSIIIDGLRRKKEAKEILTKFENTNYFLFIPSIVGFELFSGQSTKKAEQARDINDFLDYFKIVDLNWNIAKMAGKMYRDGVKGLALADYIIAATAMEIGAQVVTLNKKHFSKIPGVSIYQIP